MDTKQYGLMLAVVAVTGLLGGAVSSRLLTGSPVMAQQRAKRTRIITAQEFQLADSEGRTRAILGFSAEGNPAVNLYDADGRGRWSPARGENGIDRGPRMERITGKARDDRGRDCIWGSPV